MKATLILTTLLGVAIANPVAIANVDAPNAEKREVDISSRQLGGLGGLIGGILGGGSSLNIAPIAGFPNLGALQGLGLPGIPTNAVNAGNVLAILTSLLQGILSAIINIRQGVPGAGSLPGLIPVPPLTGVPAPAIGSGAITLEQLTALIGALQVQVQNVTTIGQNLPGGLSLSQLQAIQVIVAQIQSQIAPLLAGLPTLPNLPGGVSGNGIPGLSGLSSVTNLLAPVLSIVSSLIGPLLNSLLSSLLGNILGSLGGLGLGRG